MRFTLALHILTGVLGVAAGYIALYSRKGATTHRRSGTLFVYSMLPMAVMGMMLAVGLDKAPAVNIPAGLLTSYLVVTSLTTVRPLEAHSRASRWLDTAAMLVALAVGVGALSLGFEAIANGGKRDGIPAFPFIMFGVVGLLGATGDVRVIRTGALRGGRRLARHLWRMSFALFIGALSFSVQIIKRIPDQLRFPGLLAIPMLLVLGAMFYWLWRVRARRSLHGVVRLAVPEAV